MLKLTVRFSWTFLNFFFFGGGGGGIIWCKVWMNKILTTYFILFFMFLIANSHIITGFHNQRFHLLLQHLHLIMNALCSFVFMFWQWYLQYLFFLAIHCFLLLCLLVWTITYLIYFIYFSWDISKIMKQMMVTKQTLIVWIIPSLLLCLCLRVRNLRWL